MKIKVKTFLYLFIFTCCAVSAQQAGAQEKQIELKHGSHRVGNGHTNHRV